MFRHTEECPTDEALLRWEHLEDRAQNDWPRYRSQSVQRGRREDLRVIGVTYYSDRSKLHCCFVPGVVAAILMLILTAILTIYTTMAFGLLETTPGIG
jgi:hypothetical protein